MEVPWREVTFSDIWLSSSFESTHSALRADILFLHSELSLTRVVRTSLRRVKRSLVSESFMSSLATLLYITGSWVDRLHGESSIEKMTGNIPSIVLARGRSLEAKSYTDPLKLRVALMFPACQGFYHRETSLAIRGNFPLW